MKQEIRELMDEALQDALAPIFEELAEHNARLSAQRFLLEITYTNAFASDPKGLEQLMAELMRLTRVASTKAEPMPDDAATEIQVRIATHLQRFQQSVQQRIASGRTV